jgi:cysteine-rich repeat protein
VADYETALGVAPGTLTNARMTALDFHPDTGVANAIVSAVQAPATTPANYFVVLDADHHFAIQSIHQMIAHPGETNQIQDIAFSSTGALWAYAVITNTSTSAVHDALELIDCTVLTNVTYTEKLNLGPDVTLDHGLAFSGAQQLILAQETAQGECVTVPVQNLNASPSLCDPCIENLSFNTDYNQGPVLQAPRIRSLATNPLNGGFILSVTEAADLNTTYAATFARGRDTDPVTYLPTAAPQRMDSLKYRIVQNSETCDAGANNGQPGSAPNGNVCYAASCHYCGDGIVDATDGEQCDLGPQNGVAGSGCSATCQTVP